MTAVAFQPQYRSLRLTLLSPTLPSTTGPIFISVKPAWSEVQFTYVVETGGVTTVTITIISMQSDFVRRFFAALVPTRSYRNTVADKVHDGHRPSLCLSVSICLSVGLLFDLRRVTVVAVQDSETRVSQLTALAGKLQQSVVSVHPFPLYL